MIKAESLKAQMHTRIEWSIINEDGQINQHLNKPENNFNQLN